ncbi:hypothetical protein Tco_0563471, partial [Tanacetum coccineum]
LDMSTNGEMVEQDEDDLAKELDKLKGEIEDFKTKNKSLESSNNHFKEANNELSKTNQLMFKDLKKFQAELDRYHDVNYASKVAIDCAKAKGDLMSYKMESEKSFNEYTRKINDLNQTISEMKKELFAHQETISIMSQEKEAQIKFYKTREDKEIEKVIALENKVKALDDIVYKTGQSVQTMNMLNRNCKTSFVKPEFLKKAQRANPRLYDIGCYNDNLALMLAPESDETIRLAQESRSKLSDLIRPFDYKNLNNLYDLFVPQREKSPEQRYFSERSKMSHTPVKNENSKESFNKQTTLLEKRMDESIPWDQKEYYYADHMNAILGVYTTLDEFTDLQCDYLDQVVKCERLEKELSKSKTMSKSFEALQKHAINLELALQQYLKAQLQDKGIAISELKKLIEKMKGKSVETKFEKSSVIRQPNAFKSKKQSILVIPATSVSRPQLKSNRMEDRVMPNNNQGKKQEVEDHHLNVSVATMYQRSNSQVKDNKIDLLVQRYEQFSILEEESIDSGFARSNTIITSLKALDEGFSSKSRVRKFLKPLNPKWRANVIVIEESKYLSSLALDWFIGNLKVHEVIMEKDSEIYKGKKEMIKPITIKAKKKSSDDETLTSGSEDKEYPMAVRDFKKFFRRKGKFCQTIT